MWIFSAFITIWMNKYESDQPAPPYAWIKKFPCIMQLKIYWLSRLFNAEIFRNMLNALLVQVCFKQTVIRCIIKKKKSLNDKIKYQKKKSNCSCVVITSLFVKSVKIFSVNQSSGAKLADDRQFLRIITLIIIRGWKS